MTAQVTLAPPPKPPLVALALDDGERQDALRQLLAAILGPGENLFALEGF